MNDIVFLLAKLNEFSQDPSQEKYKELISLFDKNLIDSFLFKFPTEISYKDFPENKQQDVEISINEKYQKYIDELNNIIEIISSWNGSFLGLQQFFSNLSNLTNLINPQDIIYTLQKYHLIIFQNGNLVVNCKELKNLINKVINK